jgi:hypothetical protein
MIEGAEQLDVRPSAAWERYTEIGHSGESSHLAVGTKSCSQHWTGARSSYGGDSSWLPPTRAEAHAFGRTA